MKVLHVIWNLGQGGAQKYLLNLLNALRSYDEIENNVLVLTREGPLSEDIADACETIEYIGMRTSGDIAAAVRVFRYLSSYDGNIVHSHCNNLPFNFVLNLIKPTVIYTDHGGALLRGRKADYLLYRYLFRPIRRFIAISEYMATEMARQNPAISSRIRVVYNGIDIERVSKAEPAALETLAPGPAMRNPRVGFVGRLAVQKGAEWFLDIAERVLEHRPEARFYIVGDGVEASELKRLSREKRIDGSVKFLGYQKESERYLKAFDVLLFTSRFEPFGLVLTEAMAAEVCVVALNVRGAVTEIIRPDIDGIVIDGADCDAAAESVIRVLEDEKLRARLTAHAGERVRKLFTIERNAREIRDNYIELCGGEC